eukprot:5038210-Pyramimonas_sp.AAC.1
MVVPVGHYSIAVLVHRHAKGVVELRGVAFSVLMALHTSPHQCGHNALLRRDLANTLVLCVHHEDVAFPIYRHSTRVSDAERRCPLRLDGPPHQFPLVWTPGPAARSCEYDGCSRRAL